MRPQRGWIAPILRAVLSPAVGFAAGLALAGPFGGVTGALCALVLSEAWFRITRQRRVSSFIHSPSLSSSRALGGIEPFPRATALVAYSIAFMRESMEADHGPFNPRNAFPLLDGIAAARSLDTRRLGDLQAEVLASANVGSALGYLKILLDSETALAVALEYSFAAASRAGRTGGPEWVESLFCRADIDAETVRRAGARVIQGWVSAWTILGLPPDSPAEEVKASFRSLSRSFHPDGLSQLEPARRTQAAEAFMRVQEAYETLMSILPSSPSPRGGLSSPRGT